MGVGGADAFEIFMGGGGRCALVVLAGHGREWNGSLLFFSCDHVFVCFVFFSLFTWCYSCDHVLVRSHERAPHHPVMGGHMQRYAKPKVRLAHHVLSHTFTRARKRTGDGQVQRGKAKSGVVPARERVHPVGCLAQ